MMMMGMDRRCSLTSVCRRLLTSATVNNTTTACVFSIGIYLATHDHTVTLHRCCILTLSESQHDNIIDGGAALLLPPRALLNNCSVHDGQTLTTILMLPVDLPLLIISHGIFMAINSTSSITSKACHASQAD